MLLLLSFDHYVRANARNIELLSKHKENVLCAIQDIKAAWHLDIDPEAELQKTVDLFTRSNVTYHKSWACWLSSARDEILALM